MPEGKDGKPPYYYFKNYHKQIMATIVGYFDFECFLRKIHSCSPDDKDSYTEKYQKHVPSGFSLIFRSIDDEIFKPELHQYTAESDDDDVAKTFNDLLESSVKRIWNTVDFDKDFDGIIPEEYYTATKYWISKGELNGDKVLDHCHFKGRYRGASHKVCNLFLKMPSFVPIFSHNLSGYDAHLFIKRL